MGCRGGASRTVGRAAGAELVRGVGVATTWHAPPAASGLPGAVPHRPPPPGRPPADPPGVASKGSIQGDELYTVVDFGPGESHWHG